MDNKIPGRGRETSDSVRGAIVALRLVSKLTFHEIGKALSVEPETACHIFNRARSRAPSEDLRDILASVGNAKRPGAPIKAVKLSISSRLPRHIRLNNRRARDAAKKQKASEERAKGDEPATATTTHHPPSQERHPAVNGSHGNHQDSSARQKPREPSPKPDLKSKNPSKPPLKEQDRFRFAPVNQVSKGQPARLPPPRPPPPLLPPLNLVPNTLPVYAPTAPPVAVTAFPALANPRNGHPVPIPRTKPVARS